MDAERLAAYLNEIFPDLDEVTAMDPLSEHQELLDDPMDIEGACELANLTVEVPERLFNSPAALAADDQDEGAAQVRHP